MFKCYVDAGGDDVIDDWYNELPAKAQAKFDTLLEHFRDNPNTKWGSNHFKPLVGYDGIFEIRFQVLNVLYRPLGCFGPQQAEFTFLIGAREQGDRFVPPNALEQAVARKMTIRLDGNRAHECDF